MSFDHTLRDRDLVVERYLARQLPAEEAMAFEEHYLDCPDCLDQLEAVRSLRRGLATVAAEDAVQPAFSRRSMALAAALFLGALVPAAWFFLESRRLEGELGETRARLEATQTAGGERLAGLERELGVARSEISGLTGERDRLTGILAQERAPQPNAPFVPLAALRSGGGEAPSVSVARPAEAGRVVLALAVGPDDDGPFAVRLRQGNNEVWRGEGLHPDALGEVRVSFHRELLPPGDYQVILESAPGRVAGRYAFRVVAGR